MSGLAVSATIAKLLFATGIATLILRRSTNGSLLGLQLALLGCVLLLASDGGLDPRNTTGPARDFVTALIPLMVVLGALLFARNAARGRMSR